MKSARRSACPSCSRECAITNSGCAYRHSCGDALLDVPAAARRAAGARSAEDATLAKWTAALLARRSFLLEDGAASAACSAARAQQSAEQSRRIGCARRHGLYGVSDAAIAAKCAEYGVVRDPSIQRGGMRYQRFLHEELTSAILKREDAVCSKKKKEEEDSLKAGVSSRISFDHRHATRSKRARCEPSCAAVRVETEREWLEAIEALPGCAASPTYPRATVSFCAPPASFGPRATQRTAHVVVREKDEDDASEQFEWWALLPRRTAVHSSLRGALEAATSGDVVLVTSLRVSDEPWLVTGGMLQLRASVEIVGVAAAGGPRPRLEFRSAVPDGYCPALQVSAAHVRFAHLDLVLRSSGDGSPGAVAQRGSLCVESRGLLELDGARVISRGWTKRRAALSRGHQGTTQLSAVVLLRGAGTAALVRDSVVFAGADAVLSAAVALGHKRTQLVVRDSTLSACAHDCESLACAVSFDTRASGGDAPLYLRDEPHVDVDDRSTLLGAARAVPIIEETIIALIEETPSSSSSHQQTPPEDDGRTAAVTRSIGVVTGPLALSGAPCVQEEKRARALKEAQDRLPTPTWAFTHYDRLRLLWLGSRRGGPLKLCTEVLELISSFASDATVRVDLSAEFRIRATLRARAALLHLDRHRADSDVSKALFASVLAGGLVRAPGGAAHAPSVFDELTQDLALSRLYSPTVPQRSQHPVPETAEAAAAKVEEDYVFAVSAAPASPSQFGPCAAHTKRYAKASTSVASFGLYKRSDRPLTCVLGKSRKPLSLVYNPHAFGDGARKFEPGLDHEAARLKFWSGGPRCSAAGCALPTTLLSEPRAAARFPGLIRLLPQMIRDAQDRETLLLGLCERGHFSGQIVARGGGCGGDCDCGGESDY